MGEVGASGNVRRLIQTQKGGSVGTLLANVDLPPIATAWEWRGYGVVLIARNSPQLWLVRDGSSALQTLGELRGVQLITGAGTCAAR